MVCPLLRCRDQSDARKWLGDYGTLSGHDVFKQAKADAETWAATVESGGERARDMETVRHACYAYLKEKPGSIAEGVFRRQVYSDPIAMVKLDKLRRHHLKGWPKRLEQAPALVMRTKETEKKRMCLLPLRVGWPHGSRLRQVHPCAHGGQGQERQPSRAAPIANSSLLRSP